MAFSYIASPYTDPDPEVMHERYKKISVYTANCLKNGDFVYSPIVHCHDMAVRHSLPRTIDFWQAYDKAMLSCSKELRIVMLEGWVDSVGIKFETAFAEEVGIPVIYVSPVTYI